MDKLDIKIIEILQKDGRTPNALIAREVGVTEGTVRRRLKQLVQNQYIKVVAIPDPQKLGYVCEALVGVKIDPNKIEQVCKELTEIEHINWMAVTTGSFDIFIWVTLKSSQALGVFLRTTIGTIEGVRSTETFVNLPTDTSTSKIDN